MRRLKQPRKLSHRPSDELIDLRERGLPWLLAVFVLLLFILTLLLVYFILTSREVYLTQREKVENAENERKIAAELNGSEYEVESEAGTELTPRQKLQLKEKNEKKLSPTIKTTLKEIEESIGGTNVHVDVVPIVNRLTGEPDKIEPSISSYSVSTTIPTTTTTSTTTTTTTEEPIPSTTTPTPTVLPPSTSEEVTSAEVESASESDQENIQVVLTEQDHYKMNEKVTSTVFPTEENVDSLNEILKNLGNDFDDIELDEYVSTDITTTTATEALPTSSTTTPTTSTSPPPTTSTTAPSATTSTAPPTASTVAPKNSKRVKWNRQIRSRSVEFSKFAISTHHEKCSSIGREIYENGGNAIDSTIASEFCISAVHPHSTGPGFGAILVAYSTKRNGTYLIDGRERSPRNANQNTFVINPSIAHIGYSSMGIPGWVSTLWIAYKQFGSGKLTWKSLIEPTIKLMEDGFRIDRLLSTAFESRKNHILHEKSFGSMFNQTTREGAMFKNEEYTTFLKQLSNSTNAEHDFYAGNISKDIRDEMKKRGGLISRQDLETFTSIVTRSELIEIKKRESLYFLAGPHLPYQYPILSKVFQQLTEKYSTENPEELVDYYDDFVQLLQKANLMKMFVGDDHFEPEVKLKIDDWVIPPNFKPEEQVEENSKKARTVQSFSRILAMDNEGNAVNFMSTNTVPFGSVRRSPKYGFIWNNAMSSFDVFCHHDVNCVRGGKRPTVKNSIPSILLDSSKKPIVIISPTSTSLETITALVMQSVLMNLTMADSLDTPRIIPLSVDKVLVETGIPEELFRHLWTKFGATFTHPVNPLTLLQSKNESLNIFCDFRQSTETCFPAGI